MGHLLADLRYATRGLVRHPGLLVIAVATLAFGIGANSAIFSVVRGVILQPLPYETPERLFFVWNQFPGVGELEFPLSQPELLDWRREEDLFQGLAAVTTGEQNFLWTLELDDGSTERWRGAFVTANLFDVLGVGAARGRTLLPEDGVKDAPRVIVLSHDFWRNRFNADPSLIGQSLRVAGRDRLVVGVTPPGFHTDFNVTGARTADFWVPMFVDANVRRTFRGMRTVARLRDGVTVEQAISRMEARARAMMEEYPEAYPEARGFTVTLRSLHGRIVGDVKPPLLVLMGTVVAILLIAAVNVTNLLLVRAEGRQQEVAVRAALGASWRRIVQPFVFEGLLLTALGGAMGLAVASGAVYALRVFNPGNIPLMDTVRLDWGIAVFTAGVALVTGTIVGLIPALHASRVNLTQGVKDGSRSATGGAARHRLRRILVVTEMALAVVLVIGAGLLMKSFRALTGIDIGIRPERVLSMRMEFPTWQYPEIEQVRTTHTAILDRVHGLPDVTAASIAHAEHPLRLNGQWNFRIDGEPADPNDARPMVGIRVVSPRHLETLGVPLLAGRFFDDGDRGDAPLRIVVNETLAREWFPDRSALGERLVGMPPMPADMKLEIIGVIGNVKNEGVRQDVRPTMLLPYTNAAFATGWQRFMSLLVRTSGDPTLLTATVRETIRQVDPGLTVSQIQTLDDVVAAQVAVPRFVTMLLGAFGGLALLLAALGIYGVISYAVARRTQEIGLRMALGAARRNVIGLIMREGVLLAGAGIGLGMAGALLLTRWLEAVLYGVSPTDPMVFGGVIGLLLGVAAMATLLPARRASAIEPVTALRYE